MSNPRTWTIIPPQETRPEVLRKQYPRAYKNDDAPYILKEESGLGLGWIADSGVDVPSDDQHIFITVHQSARRQGLGSALFNKLVQEAQRRGGRKLISVHSFDVPLSGTPSQPVRFCRSLGGTLVRPLDIFHLNIPQAQHLIRRLEKLSERLKSDVQFIPAHALNIKSFDEFVRSNIDSILHSARLSLPPKKDFLEEMSLAAVLPGQEKIAGLIVPIPSQKIPATLVYNLFAVAPEYRNTPLAATLLAKSIGKALDQQWQDSRFYVLRNKDSAMWRFAEKYATLKGTNISYEFTI